MRGFSLLLAAVPAAIGIGVGAEAARQPTLYGPPGAQFTAAFLARPTVTTTSSGRIGRLVSYEARGPSGQLTVTVWTLRGSGWTGYSPVATLGSVQAFALTKGALRPPHVHLTMRPATVAGEQVTLGVSCPTRTSCIATSRLPLLRRRKLPYDRVMAFERISIDHRVMGGVPCVRGTRIPVATVVGSLADGMATEELLGEFPQLTAEDVADALRYAAAAVDERELPLRPAG